MGNTGSSSRRNHQHQPQQPQMTTNQHIVTAPSQYPNPYPTAGYRPPPPPLHNYHRYPPGAVPPPPAYVEQQKTVTIKHVVNIKKDSIRVVEDVENPGKYLLAFKFDATAPGSITVVFFGKEDEECSNLIATKDSVLKPVTVSIEQGLGQIFKLPSGTGIDFSLFDGRELMEENDTGVYPLAIKVEGCPVKNDGSDENSSGNSLISLAVFEKEKGEYVVRVIKQFLWADDKRYELQEIYGIGNSVDAESDENDIGKECVICLSEPRDTTVLPCRHMCMCSECAQVLHFQSKRCPICRQPVEGFLKIKVNDGGD